MHKGAQVWHYSKWSMNDIQIWPYKGSERRFIFHHFFSPLTLLLLVEGSTELSLLFLLCFRSVWVRMCVRVCVGSPGLQSGDIQRYSEASPAVPCQANTLTSAWHFPPAGSYPPASSASVHARCVRAIQRVCKISNSLSGSDSEEIAHRQLWVCKKKHIKLFFSAACICIVYVYEQCTPSFSTGNNF